ncbi:MAG: hypothetical protein PVI06_15390 [Desulfobacterales bacterium]|jgi:hypothetical protein
MELLNEGKRYCMDIYRSLHRVILKAYKQLPEFRDDIAQKIEGIIRSNKIL